MSLSMPDLILTLPAFAHDGPIAVAHLQLVLKHHNEIKFSTATTKIFDGAAFISRNFYSQAQISVSRLRRESDLGCTVAGCMLRRESDLGCITGTSICWFCCCAVRITVTTRGYVL
jgi:hypothetical protein